MLTQRWHVQLFELDNLLHRGEVRLVGFRLLRARCGNLQARAGGALLDWGVSQDSGCTEAGAGLCAIAICPSLFDYTAGS